VIKKDKFSGIREVGILAAIALAITANLAAPARAEYPEKPVEIIYPFGAGGSGDTLVRLFASAVQKNTGNELLIVNLPGAGGNIGFSKVARAKPDGYTLLSVSPSLAINATLFANPGYDPVEDFEVVAPLSVVPNILVVPPSSPFNTIEELIDYAKKNPGKLKFGSSGLGTSLHLAAELLKVEAGIDMVHVPYSGSANAVLDLLGGRIDLMFDSSSSSLPNIMGGKARALAIATDKRLSALPDVPTLAEVGFPKVQSSAWTGLLAPKGTPEPILEKLNQIFTEALRDEEVLDNLVNKLGGEPFNASREEFASFIAEQVEMNRSLIETLKLEKR